MLSFFVGTMTPINAIKIFSLYAGTCTLWIYLMQVFMLGGILALNGEQEARNRHSLFWWIQATPKSKAEAGNLFRILGNIPQSVFSIFQ
jgi:hypothetical protein